MMQEQEHLRWEGTGGMSQEEEPETWQHNRCVGDVRSISGHKGVLVTLPSLTSVGIKRRREMGNIWVCS